MATEKPKYIIRETTFLNHRYIMASDSEPKLIETVSRPNFKWEPVNKEARDMLEKMCERLGKVSTGETPHHSHLAIRVMKRAIAKFDGTPLSDDSDFDDIEPQDDIGAAVVVRQPADPVAALRAGAAPNIINMDRVPKTGMAAPLDDLGGEPAEADAQPSAEEPAAPVTEVPEIPADPSGEEQTLAGQQVRGINRRHTKK